MENIFFDKRDLKYCGSNVIIGKTVRIRRPQEVVIGDNVIIDDFCYIAPAMEIGDYVHISSNCSFIGGNGLVKIGRFAGVSAGSRIVAVSADYLGGGISGATIPQECSSASIGSILTIGDFVWIGANSVVLPDVIMPEGMACGALSLITKKKYREWTMYVGNPAKKLCERDRVLSQQQASMLTWR